MIQRSYIINENGDYEPMSYVHAMVVNRADKATLQPIIEQFVSEGSRVVTDELSAYNGLSERGYLHDIVKHGAEEYANDDIFTNSIEDLGRHLRRMIFGCYHDVSDKYCNVTLTRLSTVGIQEKRTIRHAFPICSPSPSDWLSGGKKLIAG